MVDRLEGIVRRVHVRLPPAAALVLSTRKPARWWPLATHFGGEVTEITREGGRHGDRYEGGWDVVLGRFAARADGAPQ